MAAFQSIVIATFVALWLCCASPCLCGDVDEDWFNHVVVSTDLTIGESVSAADLDGDGDIDLLSASRSDNKVAWYENIDGKGTFGTQNVLDPGLTEARAVIAADFDGDGRLDVAATGTGSSDNVRVYLNLGSGSFTPAAVVGDASGAQDVAAADMDGDGDLDLVVAAGSAVWFSNNALSWQTMSLPISFSQPEAVAPGDFDQDGDMDFAVVTFLTDKVFWVEQTSPGVFADKVEVPSSLDEGQSIIAADLDSDGDLDLATASSGDGRIAWIPNLGGGTWGSQITVTDQAAGARSVHAADIDSDGDLDLLSASLDDNKLAWYEQLPGGLGFSSQKIISTAMNGGRSVFAADIDGDGALDCATASESDNAVAWYPFRGPLGGASAVSLEAPFTELVLETPATLNVTISVPTPGCNASYAFSVLTRRLESTSRVLIGTNEASFDFSPFCEGLGPGISYAASLTFTPVVAFPHAVSARYYEIDVAGSPAYFDVTFSCPPGTRVGQAECIPCPASTYAANVSSLLCTPCPTRMTGPPVSTSFLACGCPTGEWFGPGVRVEGALCQACPPGASCPGGLQDPVAAPGFYASFPDGGQPQYLPCLRSGCVGNNTCAPGYTPGFLCSACAPGFFSSSPSSCTRCPGSSDVRLAFLLLAFVAVCALAAGFVGWSAARSSPAALSPALSPSTSPLQAHILAFRVRSFPATLSMVVTAFQVAGLVAEADLGWSSTSKSALSLFSLFTVNVQVLGAECSLASFSATYLLSTILPVAGFVLVVGGVLTLRTVWGPLSVVPARTLVDVVVFTLAPLAYIPLARATFVLFDCVELPDGRLVIESDNGVSCLDAAWWRLFPLAALWTCAFLAGFPLYFAVSLFTHRDALFEPKTTARLGSLFRHFRRAFVWGEVAGLGKRLSIVVAITFLSRHQAAQVLAVVSILLASVLVTIGLKPYYYPRYNVIDTTLSIFVMLLLLAGLGAHAERSSGSSSLFLTIVTLGIALTFALFSAAVIATDTWSILQERRASQGPALKRKERLMGIIADELQDVEADPELLTAAGHFLSSLDASLRDSETQEPLSSAPFDDAPVVVAMEDL